MAIDALRSYLQLASGLTDVTKDRAKAAAQALVSANPLEGGASAVSALGTTVSANASALADDLIAASKANRQLLIGLIRSEVDRAVHRLGLATGDEVDALSERVARLEGSDADVSASSATKKPAAKKSPVAKKTAGTTSGQKKTAVKKSAAKKTAVKKSVATLSTIASSTDAPSEPVAPSAAEPLTVGTEPAAASSTSPAVSPPDSPPSTPATTSASTASPSDEVGQ